MSSLRRRLTVHRQSWWQKSPTSWTHSRFVHFNFNTMMILRVIIAQVLNNHLRKAEAAHKRLTSAKCKLEHNISVKITSINIDANLLMNREVKKNWFFLQGLPVTSNPICLQMSILWIILHGHVFFFFDVTHYLALAGSNCLIWRLFHSPMVSMLL